MLTLYVCSKTASLASNDYVQLDLMHQDESEVNNKLTVDNLMVAIKNKLSLTGSLDDYQLICFGKKLKGDQLLSHYGIKSNSIVYILLKNAEERSANKKMDTDSNSKGKGKKVKFDQSEVHAMVIASRTALLNQSFRQMLSRLHENDFRNNLIQCTPGLKDDPIAIAVLHDSDLLTMMMDPSIIEKVLEKHPAILEAATHLATAFHEESASPSNRGPTPMAVDPSQFSYSLDELSEDDEMTGGVDAPPPNGQHVMSPTTASAFAHLMQQALLASHSSQRGASGGPGGSQQNQAQHPSPSPMTLPPNLTPQQIQQLHLTQLQQLQAQHLQQQQQQQPQLQQQSPQSAQQHQQPPRQPDNAIIAFEMLRHALQLTEPSTSQQGNNSSQASASNPISGQSSAPSTQSRPDMSKQIAQMRELGLTDENVCLEALIATNGDVQAAIELIFSESSHS